ncbi:MAG: tRNA (N(6)-L-threonylcarbamoyladenosine(37)-C(2))-methylthiotransferase MtaB [Planctomycetaceae bacterium]|nr:tRNA (N(6)-L-threonylcarbamoyladenosine(37)-C(2))-methylthiotransferase MtaB [Planctomycetaceae bacterium]
MRLARTTSSTIAAARCEPRSSPPPDGLQSPPEPQSALRLKSFTLGCKVNQYETEFVRQGLLTAGYRDAAADERADLCIVNTCTVTAEGDAKSRQLVRRLARDNPAARIVVMGCYATRAPDEVASLPGVTEVVTDKRELPDWLTRAGVSQVPSGISTFAGRQRAFVKVQDGCLLNCSFCIIPQVRPGLASRPAAEIVAEVARLVANGYHEVVLTGIHLGHYGVDMNRGREKSAWLRLSHLLERLVELPGEFRIRLSSIEATEVTRELVEVMAAHPRRIAPHVHLALQSGSDAVLQRMRRRGGAQRYLDRCRLVQRALDLPAITTDIIVGFPGETEAEFAETLALAREVGFAKIHAFTYSPRRGTDAARLSDQVPAAIKAARYERLVELDRELQQAFQRRLLGRELNLLVETPVPARSGWMQGTACRSVSVRVAGGAELRRQLVRVAAVEMDATGLVGELCRPEACEPGKTARASGL